MPADLTLESLGYRYPRGDRDALHEVSTTLRGGACSAVMGASGAGKSTLLQALAGIVPTLSGGELRGRVRYGRADLAAHRVQTITEYIGLVLQDPAAQVIGRTVFEDVALGPRNHLVARDEVRRRVSESLRRVGLGGFEPRATGELSGGEQQRLAIAGVLAMAPEVLCLDEATAELDPAGAAAVRGVLAELQSGGIGIVLAEHDPQVVLERAEHLVVLTAGELAWQGSPADFFADAGQAQRFGIRPAPMAEVAWALLDARPELPRPQRVPVTVPGAEAWVRALAESNELLPVEVPQAVPTAACGRAVIEVVGLHFGYPGRPEVLRGIDVRIEEGEFVALVGANGAGKSTLAKQLNGLLRPRTGSVRVAGRDVAGLEAWQLAREVGFVFQNPDHQLFCATVADEVGYALRVAGRPADEVRRRVAAVLDLTGLDAVADQNPLTLGRGQRQLVAMASTLVSEPGVLVLDEPTTGQDRRGATAVMGLVDRLNRLGTTIIMISHDPDLIARHARRVITLEHGRVVADGPTAQHVTTEVSRLWGRLFGRAATPILDEVAAGRALARCLRSGS